MPKFRVPVKIVVTEIFIVEADSAEAAMNLVYDDFDSTGDLQIQETTEGEPEIYYPDITEVVL